MTAIRLLFSINLSWIMCESWFLLRIEYRREGEKAGGGAKSHSIQHGICLMLSYKTNLRI